MRVGDAVHTQVLKDQPKSQGVCAVPPQSITKMPPNAIDAPDPIPVVPSSLHDRRTSFGAQFSLGGSSR